LKKILIIQTAFIGDAILVSALLEALHAQFPESQIDLLLRKGNESLYDKPPFLKQCFTFSRKKNKLKETFRLIKLIRNEKYDAVINVQRFFTSGLLTAFSGAKTTIGFQKNPLSIFFSHRIPHQINTGMHEVERNALLLKPLGIDLVFKPKLYPFDAFEKPNFQYVCIAPASVWFTKQLPEEKWVELINKTNSAYTIFILGSKADNDLAQRIIDAAPNKNVVNLCGKISLLQSAVLMKLATMNYVNDSAPLHLASSVNAPVTAFFCSTIPEFGFGPLSENSQVIQTEEKLICRPCGLHGKKACPEGHFKCGKSINISSVPNT
jgi:heptosyltransferase-2